MLALLWFVHSLDVVVVVVIVGVGESTMENQCQLKLSVVRRRENPACLLPLL